MKIVSAFPRFESASSEVLAFLNSRLAFDLWMVTRTESEDWIVLDAHDRGYDVKAGDVFRWTDSFCSRMVEGLGPRIAPKSDDVAAYASAPIGRQVPIGAYIGIPLSRPSGELFGTLCAIDPNPMPPTIVAEQSLIEMMGQLLMTVLETELEAQTENRRAERAEAKSLQDSLTKLYNRRGWESLMATENHRCQRYGHPACMVSIDLDEMKYVNDQHGHAEGDALLQRAADVLVDTSRESDIVARLGGDEFAILAVECDAMDGHALLNRLEEAFRNANILASMGMQMRQPQESLQQTFERADHAMYAAKRARKDQSLISIGTDNNAKA